MRMQKITILTICLGTFLAGIIITPVAFAETYTVINAQESFQRGCEETTNACFDPSLITIRVGDMIIWENVDSQGHNVANGFDLSSDDVGKVFDSDFIDPGASFSHTFNVVGTYDYFCMIHPWMKGTVIVEKTEFPPEPGVVDIHVEGDLAPEDIALSATKLPNAMLELMDMAPQWHSDMLGVMQLIVITQIELALRNRL